MSGAPPLERSLLEGKERGELQVIAESLGLNPGGRMRKAELVDSILEATGAHAPRPTPAPLARAAHDNGEARGAPAPAEPRDGAPAPEGPGAAAPADAMAGTTAGAGAGTAPPTASPNGAHGPAPDQPRAERQWQPRPQNDDGGGRRRRRRGGRGDRPSERDFAAAERAASSGDHPDTGEPVPIKGLLDLRDEGFGFIRASGYVAGPDDVYVATAQVKRFGLRRGDLVEGVSRPAGPSEKFPALLRIDSVSGLDVEEARGRRRFEDLTPLFPDTRLRMESPADPLNITARIIDLMCPIGLGQRGLIVSPPKAGKTTVIKQVARSIERNNPEVHLMVLLVDERPEEVTDMRRTVKGEVVASTFDRPADEHTQVAELALERAKRMVEAGRDVVIILDGITRLTRAYNLSAPSSGRLTSGGIDQAAIYPPKKFFGAARNAEEGGSLTILATALVETGSKADDVIFEELKGTGNMELRLDRRLAERRLYPAIDVNASSTRHEELLFDRGQLQLVWRLRRVLNGLADDGATWKALELLMDKIKTTRTNDEFLAEVAKTQLPV
jgi:transcription termination factor Rho